MKLLRVPYDKIYTPVKTTRFNCEGKEVKEIIEMDISVKSEE